MAAATTKLQKIRRNIHRSVIIGRTLRPGWPQGEPSMIENFSATRTIGGNNIENPLF
jgi:hypothetical protein